MGSFTKFLSTFLNELASREAERQRLLTEKEDELRRAVSQLTISESEKKKLEKQITELRQPSKSIASFPDVSQLSSGRNPG